MLDDRQSTAQIERFLRRARGPVSQADIAAGTGLDGGTVDRLMRSIMLVWECTLDVRGDGTLVYDFGGSLRRIGRVPFGERARRFGRMLWRGFSAVYRASLAIVLLTYAVVFVVLIIAAAIASVAASKDGDAAEGAFHLVAAVFRAILETSTHVAAVYPSVDHRGYAHRHFEPKHPVMKKSRGVTDKAFIASVYDFVLGPPRVKVKDGAQDREIAAFVRREGGILTVADVMALSGMDRVEASRFFSRFVAAHDGDVTITDDGALVAQLPSLLASETTAYDEPIVAYWHEYEPPHEVTGNTMGRNMGIIALAAFNVFGALTVPPMLELSAGLAMALGAVPLVIFGLYLVLPMLRAPLVWWRNRKRRETNVRKRVYRALFETSGDVVRLDALVAAANAKRTTEEALSVDGDADVLGAAIEAIGGRRDLDDEDGAATAALERLRREQNARAEHRVEVQQGEVVFSTRGA